MFEDTKGKIRSCKSKKDRQYNDQNKRNKRTNNDVRNTTQKTKDRETRTSLKPWANTWLIRAKLCRNNIWNVLCCKKSV